MPAPVDELAHNTRVSDLEIYFDSSESGTNPSQTSPSQLHINPSRSDLHTCNSGVSTEEFSLHHQNNNSRSRSSFLTKGGDSTHEVIRASNSSIDCLFGEEEQKKKKLQLKKAPQEGLITNGSLSLDPSTLLPSELNCFNPKELNISKDVEFLSDVVSKEKAELFSGLQTEFSGIEPGAEELLEALRTMEGIPESNTEVVKWKLRLRLRSHFSRGETLDTFVEKELDVFFRWQNVVMGKEGSVLEMTESLRENTPEMVYLMFVWYLIYASMGNLKTLWCFRCFLFHQTLKLRRDAVTSGLPIGKWIIEQVSSWYEISRQNSNKRKEERATMDCYLNYDDINTLFYSKDFIELWLDDKRRVELANGGPLPASITSAKEPKEKKTKKKVSGSKIMKQKAGEGSDSGDALVGQSFKTYLEKSNKTLFGIVSWVSFYRNYYWLALVYCVHLTISLLLTTHWWWPKLIIGGTLIVGSYICKVLADWWLKPPCEVPRADLAYSSPQDAKARREKIVAWVMAGILIFFKTLINVFVFYLCELVSPSLLKRGIIHVIGIWGFVISGYFLDTLFIYNIHLAVVGYWYGKRRGVGYVKTWSIFQKKFKEAKKGFYQRILFTKKVSATPEGQEEGSAPKLNKHQRRVAWAKFWNECVRRMHEEDYLSKKEKENYSFILAEDRTGGENFLSGLVVKFPDFTNPPKNQLAQERLQEIINTMYMKDIPTGRSIAELPTITTLIPVYNETVIYSIEDVARPLNTGKTVLAFMIYKYPDEWENFLERNGVRDSRELSEIANSLVNGVFVGENLHEPSKKSQFSEPAQRFLEEVRHWTSNRFQALSRTVRGISYRLDAYKLLARIQNPEWSAEKIDRLCAEKFQLLVAYQTYANLKMDNPSDVAKKEDLMYLSRKYSSMDIAYIINDGGYYYGVRLNQEKEVARLWLPGFPILWEGKPENQVCALGFAWGDYIQALDMNQDGYFEEEIKFPNLLQEFEKDPWVKIVGFPERVTTKDFNAIGFMHAFSERTFTTCVNRVMSLYGVRQHYGHPDVFDGTWVETEGGMSKQCYVSEDIFGGYEVTMKGRRNIHIDYLQEAKGKEVGVLTTTKFFTKTSAGGAQQLYTRWLYWLNTSPNFPPIKRFHHFFLALGYYFEHSALKYALAFFVFTRIIFAFGFDQTRYAGTGGSFAEMFSPANLLLGVWVLQLGYLMGMAGFAEMLLERGWRGGVSYLKWFWGLLFFYIFHILTNASGFGDGILSRAKYIPTGRTFMLEHVPFRNIYTAFKGSHLYYTFILSFTMFAWTAFIGFSTFAVLWSMLLCVLIWFSFPFMMNPGSTPLGVPIRLWALLLYDDWVDYMKYSRNVLLYSKHLHWPAVFAITVTALALAALNFQLWWFFLLLGICFGLMIPWLRMFYFAIGFISMAFLTAIGIVMLPLVMFHRYWYYKEVYPLAPWLYSSETFDLIQLPKEVKKVKKQRRIIRRKKRTPLPHGMASTALSQALSPATSASSASPSTLEEITIINMNQEKRPVVESLKLGEEEEEEEVLEEVEEEVEAEEESTVSPLRPAKSSYIDNTFTMKGADRRRIRLPLTVENTFCFDRADTLMVPAPRRTRVWDALPQTATSTAGNGTTVGQSRLMRHSTFHHFNDFRNRSRSSRGMNDDNNNEDDGSSYNIPEVDVQTTGIGATYENGSGMLPQPLKKLLSPEGRKGNRKCDSYARLRDKVANETLRQRRDAQRRREALKSVSLFTVPKPPSHTPVIHRPSALVPSATPTSQPPFGTSSGANRRNLTASTGAPLTSSSHSVSISSPSTPRMIAPGKSPRAARYQLQRQALTDSQRIPTVSNSSMSSGKTTKSAFSMGMRSVNHSLHDLEESMNEIEGFLPTKVMIAPGLLDPELADLGDEDEGDFDNYGEASLSSDDIEEYASENDDEDDDTHHDSDEYNDYEEDGTYL